ncbi:CCQ_1a_G0022540.mRNA.1.CDS.1 [Saccharomyces cerevisiae]|nr:CCQ_1a_G0022540.mRNA.1.CDS.1 [Saccharomyces cerevisiae]CAI7316488.1 CCQ_1a_G0022540.mRNA.1.CDS.1 [Saccharomyces cerevisiae]
MNTTGQHGSSQETRHLRLLIILNVSISEPFQLEKETKLGLAKAYYSWKHSLFGTLFYLGNHVQSRSFVGTIFQDQETVISIFNAEKSVKDFKALTFLSRGHNAPFHGMITS